MTNIIDQYLEKGRAEGSTSRAHQDAENLFANGASFDLVSKSLSDIPTDELQAIFDSVVKNQKK